MNSNTQGSLRGRKWVFESPLNHNPKAHFPKNRIVVHYSWKSAAMDDYDGRWAVESSQSQFCGCVGLRTIFKYKTGCLGYKIADFSDFPHEKEILMPVLARFMVHDVIVGMTVTLRKDPTTLQVIEDEDSIRTEAFRWSQDHFGNADVIELVAAQ